MSGFFGVASKEDCVLELFYGVVTIPIWEQDVEVWQFMGRTASTVRCHQY